MIAQNELLTRAVEQVVPKELAEQKLKSGKPMRLYLGIDPTGARLHLGHSVPLRKLKAFADAGHHVIFLVGSFTAMIGDPSGRDAMREPMTKEKVEENFQTYRMQAEKILDFSKVEIVYNHEWLEKLSANDMLQIASSFTVQQMIRRDMFQKRIKEDSPISVMEFFYPLLVGYDSVMLDVDCEIGGSDQLFNMLCGRTLQQAYGKRDKFVLTTKLIEGTDGRKMSKTYDNCIWLTDEAADMYGKILSIKDNLMLTIMECATEMPMEEIKDIEKQLKKGSNPKDAKMRLAREIVTLYHGEEAASAAEAEFQKVFSEGGLPDDMPELKVTRGGSLIDVLVEKKFISSKSDARRLIEQKGITMNDNPVTAIDQKVEEGVVRVGKRKFVRMRL